MLLLCAETDCDDSVYYLVVWYCDFFLKLTLAAGIVRPGAHIEGATERRRKLGESQAWLGFCGYHEHGARLVSSESD